MYYVMLYYRFCRGVIPKLRLGKVLRFGRSPNETGERRGEEADGSLINVFFCGRVSIFAIVLVAANADGNTTTAAPEVETTTTVSPTVPPTVPPTVAPTEAPTTTAKPTAAPTKAPHAAYHDENACSTPTSTDNDKTCRCCHNQKSQWNHNESSNAKDNGGLGAGWIILIVVLSLLVAGGVGYGILVWRRNKRGVARHSLSFFETDDSRVVESTR